MPDGPNILRIATIGHPVLRQRAREVGRDELPQAPIQRLIDDMIATMRDADGAGLAAPQVHVLLRICVVEVEPEDQPGPEAELMVLVNPRITPLGAARVESWEACLSVPGLHGRVRRPAAIRLEYVDRDGQTCVREARGFEAVVFQHECDHLDGQLYVDKADPRSLTTLENYRRYHAEP